jgi:WD40 repeat protein
VFLLTALILAAVTRAQEGALPPAAKVEIDFKAHIQPILEKTCHRCHGPKKQQSEYRLDSREAALKDGEIGGAIVVGDSAKSKLIQYVAQLDEDLKMPPTGKPLTPEQVGLFRAWIDQGLPWPADAAGATAEAVELKQYFASLEGHKGPVTAVAFSADGRFASAGGQSLLFRPGEVKLWDLAGAGAERKEAAQLDGHASAVWCASFSPDGKLLATGSYDRVVKLWDVDGRKERATLEGHANWVTCVAFSPDGATLASGSEDTTVKLWDVASGKEKGTLAGHGGTVRALVFSPDGALLATASFDKTVKLWSRSADGAYAETAAIAGHEDWVWTLAFSPDGKRLATAGADNTVKLWALPPADGKCAAIAALPAHGNWVTSLAFSPDSKRLATASFDRTVKVWDLEMQAPVEVFSGHKGTIWSVAFTPDGKSIATGSQDGSIKMWEVAAEYRVRRF